jgi:hypothetical protein
VVKIKEGLFGIGFKIPEGVIEVKKNVFVWLPGSSFDANIL